MSTEHERFIAVVLSAARTFEMSKEELSDLPRQFWVAMMDLELGCNSKDWDELVATFKSARKQLGSPGDFGYGTPCGDALRDVYNSWNALCEVHKPRDSVA